MDLGNRTPSRTVRIPDMPTPLIAFDDVGRDVFSLAAVALVILILALLAAAANVFFRNVDRFEDDVLEATMELSPGDRRRFFELYRSRRPKNAAVAWFLAVGLGPAGVNLYRGKPLPFVAALFSLNGLGAWWIESWFTAPQFVLIENRGHIAWVLQTMSYMDRVGPRLHIGSSI
ncbi:MAG: hypothetical protein IAI48_03790 [Candidatus Eremiobacteraeota bacterium]|nr:hypothetical protein [Candidatus Eremiobacteraeota bacterium]